MLMENRKIFKEDVSYFSIKNFGGPILEDKIKNRFKKKNRAKENQKFRLLLQEEDI
jgi:hypothetical protein